LGAAGNALAAGGVNAAAPARVAPFKKLRRAMALSLRFDMASSWPVPTLRSIGERYDCWQTLAPRRRTVKAAPEPIGCENNRR
jgi:hypothetical protein